MTTPIRVSDRGGVRLLELTRPPANAIDETLLAALDAALAEAEQDVAVRALLLTGSGRFFCAGFDLSAPRRDDDDAAKVVALYRASHRRLLAFPKPTVALVNGHAIAGGLVLALACDVRLAADVPASIGLNEIAIGSSFPTAAIEIVRARLSARVAAKLTLGAELYPLAEGVTMGVVECLLPPAAALEQAQATAARLGAFPQEVFAHTKRTLIGEALERIDAVPMSAELAAAELWRTPESRAARAAQRERLGRRASRDL
jgi:enoyl-CoA hydratase